MKLEDLKKPFPKEKIHWRVGATNKDKTKGIALAYLDARDVMERLDEVCGMENWQCRYPFPGCCEIGILVSQFGVSPIDTIEGTQLAAGSKGEWIWKSNGAGTTQVEAEKGQYSDAFKRAGVLWGIGQYLYDLPNEWVPIEPYGRSYKLSRTPNLPNWALPGARISQEVVRDFVSQVNDALGKGDDDQVRALWSEWTEPEEKQYLWGRFNSQQRALMKEIGA